MVDPLLGGMVDERGTISDLHRRVRAEARDPDWAPEAEIALRTRYESIAKLRDGGPIRVICATDICEVGVILPEKGTGRIMSELHGEALKKGLAARGFTIQAMGFGRAFVAYVTLKR